MVLAGDWRTDGWMGEGRVECHLVGMGPQVSRDSMTTCSTTSGYWETWQPGSIPDVAFSGRAVCSQYFLQRFAEVLSVRRSTCLMALHRSFFTRKERPCAIHSARRYGPCTEIKPWTFSRSQIPKVTLPRSHTACTTRGNLLQPFCRWQR